MVITTYSDGDVLSASDLNTNFGYLGYFTYTSASQGSSGGANTTYYNVEEVTIPADTLSAGNLVVFGDVNWSTSSASWDYIKIVIDGVDYNELATSPSYGICNTIASVQGLDTSTSHTISVQVKKSAGNSYTAYANLRILGI